MIAYDRLLERFKELLKSNGLKYTKQRELIVRCLYHHEVHYTPEELHQLLKQRYPEAKIGIATVYRTLSLLEESGIATSISFGVQGKKYEFGLKKHHDHLICTQCGTIIEFFDEKIEQRQEEIAEKFNFRMTDHMMKIVGLCEACRHNET